MSPPSPPPEPRRGNRSSNITGPRNPGRPRHPQIMINPPSTDHGTVTLSSLTFIVLYVEGGACEATVMFGMNLGDEEVDVMILEVFCSPKFIVMTEGSSGGHGWGGGLPLRRAPASVEDYWRSALLDRSYQKAPTSISEFWADKLLVKTSSKVIDQYDIMCGWAFFDDIRSILATHG
ncbi:hypothetical protein HYDPIDRAFT_169177 [Hydnomerulius pinastri MD-312]|uniref:Uncharacterized protein n=1 Tax=Hydnomerulius pinastri MD-312 TaxID=994086 RepID=A0A0C9WCL1_9AGAM|nr:hypothetical protein HYDPIDRAFT_169177 [Hydnomerulius pinastri MD-312]